ncbi:hypothetical protein PVAND_010729 [Polypedilum vanderplanki]|uniref:PPM-type phosphatase domain-containing protein n=1 Tax=Polypedilum vanderplanki TaxID=319348 RepID=A0A9J6CI76_POLVA|nr:hypothetical protein PVAND_010729 [Polypedilum vanderplanki]
MEEFKQLKWSWYKYEEEKKIPPRDFSFSTINDADALNRNLNEIHMSVLKKQDEYRLFKTPEKIAPNLFGKTIDDKIFELQDPRKQTTIKLKSSFELIKCFSYLSELSKNEQISLLNSIEDKSIHNPKFLKHKKRFFRKKLNNISPQLIQKWQNEVIYFNKCAEIHYYRHIKELGMILRDNLSLLLTNHWDSIRNELKVYNYQAITMISRNTISQSKIEIKHIANKSEEFNEQMYMISPSSFFCNLQNYSIDNIRHYISRHRIVAHCGDIEDINYDLKLSLGLLKNFILPKKEFITSFKNDGGKINFTFDYSIPLQNVDCCEALEEAIEKILMSNIEWNNISENLKFPKKEKENEMRYQCQIINDFMEKIHGNYKIQAKENTEINLWSIESEKQSFILCVKTNTYFVRQHVRAIVSIKLEYQTNFGAEQMAKEELLKEWIQLKLTENSVVIRYRIDVKSYEILSVQELEIIDIENELKINYNCNPLDIFESIFNLFRCIRNLPNGIYLIFAKNESECSKFLIYKEDVNGKSLSDLQNSFQISHTFTRNWVPIDMKTTTFVHLNELIAPCCFSYKTINKSSYVIKNPENPKSANKNIIKKQEISKIQQSNFVTKNKLKRFIMPSLGQKVFGYFRQLSFIAEPREEIKPTNECFVTKFLQSSAAVEQTSSSSSISLPITSSLTQIYSGKQPNDLPDLTLKNYEIDVGKIVHAITGPNEGLTYCRRSRLHLSIGGDIEFIDDKDEEVRHNPKRFSRKLSNVSRKSTQQDSIGLKPSDFKKTTDVENNETDLIANVTHWNADLSNENGYGIAISLYEKNPITNEHSGSPIADCYGMISRHDSCIMAMADGVNWGEKARLASCSAVQASIEYLSKVLFSQNTAKNTHEVFVSLLRSFWAAQDFILEQQAHLTTLTVAVVLPIEDTERYENKYVVCSCNVGDSLGFVYSKKHGVREFTQGSHDIQNNRDMRDALGALGPVDGNKPELSNLTLAMTIVEKGDIVFLTSDGVSDNFDPVVGKFAEIESDPPETEQKVELAPKRQNKSAPIIQSTSRRKHDSTSKSSTSSSITTTTSSKFSSQSFSSTDIPIRPPRTKKTNLTTAAISSPMPILSNEQLPIRPKYMRSKTLIDARYSSSRSSSVSTKSSPVRIKKSAAGLPIVTAEQRHALTLLRMADLFRYGINGTLRPCTTAKKLCSLLIDFTKMITSAKRKLLEQRELFWKMSYDAHIGQRKEVEMTRLQQRAARKKCVDTYFSTLPGKLDHASCVAWCVGIEDGNNNNNINSNELLLDPKTKKSATLTLNPSTTLCETDF